VTLSPICRSVSLVAQDGSVRGGTGDPYTDVAGALHDVSNALTVILGWAAEARAGSASASAMLHALEVIEQQAQIARELARRAIGADTSVSDEETHLHGVLGGAVEALAVQASLSGVRIALSGSAAGARVRRGTDLRQIVTNLVLNALAEAPRGSEVMLDVAVEASRVTLDVQDQGPGVPEARRETLFEGGSSRTGGAGIGLRHARVLARAAGGDLELVATLGGALFRLTWPRWAMPSAPPSSAANLPVLQGTRVLVVEDDEHVALLLETALGARGATVRVARDAAEFDVEVQARSHDVALVDLSPIAMDAKGAIDRLREHSPRIAIVFISGSAAGLPDELLEENVRWVRKPFEVPELVAAVLAARDE
jgi:CheY-like chemotaxis protein